MKNILFSFFALSSVIAFAQKNATHDIKVNDTAFLTFLEGKIIGNFHSRLSNIGEWGTCWIRFELSPENKINSISISNGTNQTFRAFLKEVIESTNGKWTFPKEFNDKDYRMLIVPLWYNLMKDGKANRVENSDDQILPLLSSDSNRPQKVILFPKLEYISPFISSWSPTFNASKK